MKPPKIETIVCVICQTEVTKRSSLSLETFGREGRACRKHEDVQRLVDEAKAVAKDSAKWAKAQRNFDVISYTSAVRMAQAVLGVDPETTLCNLGFKGVAKDVLAEVRVELERLGPLTTRELGSAMFGAMLLRKGQQI